VRKVGAAVQVVECVSKERRASGDQGGVVVDR